MTSQGQSKEYIFASHFHTLQSQCISLLWHDYYPFALLSLAQDTNLDDVRKAFVAAHIPQDLTVGFDPTVLLEVSLPQASGGQVTLHAGIKLSRNATAGPPRFRVRGSAGEGPFVIATVDPDAPTPQKPTISQLRHLLGGNFVLSSTSDPAVIGQYYNCYYRVPATRPAGGLRSSQVWLGYVFLLFKQAPSFNNQSLVTAKAPRTHFNISQFAAVTGIGSPIAGTFMLVGPGPPS